MKRLSKLNLTEILLCVLALTFLFLWATKSIQYRKKDKQYQETVVEASNLKKDLLRTDRYIYELSDILDKQKAISDSILEKKNQITRLYISEKKRVEEMSGDSLYIRFKGSHTPSGTLYDIDSTLLSNAELTSLKLIECKEISKQQLSEIDVLNEYMDRCFEDGLEMYDQYTDCAVENETLKADLKITEGELKEKKIQVWTTRAVGGAGFLMFLLVLL